MSGTTSHDHRGSQTTDDADRDVLERVAAGELDALEELYDRYKALAYGVALRITRDASLAEDVVQEAFLGCWRNASRFDRERASVRTWLLSIVHHRAVDAIRRRRPAAALPTAEELPASLTVPDVWGAVASRLEADEVRAALSALPATQREAIELAYFDGLTQQEIAVRTSTPLGTVKSRMRLGLVGLRRSLIGEKLDEPSVGATRSGGLRREDAGG